jgi:hypothetical protein
MAENKETINVTKEIVKARYLDTYLAKLFTWLLTNNPTLKRPTPQEQEQIQEAAVKETNARYANTGIELTT